MSTAATTYTLPDGRVVPIDSHPARIDREVRAMHVEQMMRTDTEGPVFERLRAKLAEAGAAELLETVRGVQSIKLFG